MRVLVTGARGFVGRNLCCALKNVRDGKDRRAKYQQLLPLEVMEYDVDSTQEELEDFCSRADFVFNLAGVNRPKEQSEFMEGNFGFASTLLDALERHGNKCPVMLSSSAQASLSGRYEGSVYGESKLAGEGLFRGYSERTGAPVLIYRFPNLYGKWCRPRYNSAVATFCDAVANGRPYTVNDPSELVFDYRLPIRSNIDHILGDEENLTRIPASLMGEGNSLLLRRAFEGAVVEAARRAAANYTLAVPQFYGGRIQLLLPLCLTGDKPELALTIQREDGFYAARTCLTLEMAYNNARLICRPETSWIKR